MQIWLQVGKSNQSHFWLNIIMNIFLGKILMDIKVDVEKQLELFKIAFDHFENRDIQTLESIKTDLEAENQKLKSIQNLVNQ